MELFRVSGAIAIVIGLMAASAMGATANFDSKTYGPVGTELVDGGIRFYDIVGPVQGFVIERTTIDSPGYSSPNLLGIGDQYLQPGILAFWPVNSYKIALATPGLADCGSVELFTDMWGGLGLGNTVTLEAWRAGAVVNSSTVKPTYGMANHYTLSVAGVPFDYLRLVGGGAWSNGAYYGVVDNVAITPEPASAALLLAGFVMLRRRMKSAAK